MNSCAPVGNYPSWMSSVPSAGVQSWLILLGAVMLYIGVIALLMWRYPRGAEGPRNLERFWLLVSLVSFTLGVFLASVVNPSWTEAIWAWYNRQLSLAGGQPCVIDQIDARFGEALVRTSLLLNIALFLCVLSIWFLIGFVYVRTRRVVQ